MPLTPQLVARYPVPGGSAHDLDPTGPVPLLTVRDAQQLTVHELRDRAEPIAVFPAPEPPGLIPRHWVAPDNSLAVFATGSGYVATAPDGARLWELPYGTWDGRLQGYVQFSVPARARELWLWLRLPSGRPDSSLIVTMDAAGEEIARHTVPLGGHRHPVHLVFGEDGLPAGVSVTNADHSSTGYRASWLAGRISVGPRLPDAFRTRLLHDREYLDVHEASERWMTLGLRREDVAWHRYGDPEPLATLRLTDFPAPGTGDCDVHFAPSLSGWGGFVDADTALVSLHNSYDEARVLMFDGPWQEYSHWLADPATGELHGRIAYPMHDVDTVTVLGDGTWITTEWDGLNRWRA